MLSVIIIAKNEEEKIGECLKSVSWADEVLVIDNDSQDNTSIISEKYKATVIDAPDRLSLKYSDLRNLGLKRSKGDWVLYVDADERVSKELKSEIETKVLKENIKVPYSSYAIPRRNIIFGKEFKYGGQYPDYVKRLFKKSKLNGWTGELHEEPEYKGEMGHLENVLVHEKHNNIHEMIEKTNKWSETEARLMFEAGHPKMNVIRFSTAMLREFYLRLVRQKAFLDGVEGIIYGIYQVYSKFISYAKLWEMQKKQKKL